MPDPMCASTEDWAIVRAVLEGQRLGYLGLAKRADRDADLFAADAARRSRVLASIAAMGLTSAPQQPAPCSRFAARHGDMAGLVVGDQ
ncbi:hypothetical protein UFOVP78_37 [uncultured Caudovirales phage]|uniref:Uncharacterized protein n=1 Tax=uncultured Caudovirales phage TaxID=2100421 RepID=A0A6J5KWZ5_9CAUD|nr:hypothetical protein UFOVP78_37 [uncultured Caudovirales phage]